MSATADGLTLAEYAEYCRVPVAFLRSYFNLHDHPTLGGVEIPYGDGKPVKRRRRLHPSTNGGEYSKGDDRFVWPKGSRIKHLLYARHLVPADASDINVVEGESDTHILHFRMVTNTVGLPGAKCFGAPEQIAFVSKFQRVRFVIEPGEGGKWLEDAVRKSPIACKAYAIRLGELKDPRKLYLDDPATFRKRWDETVAKAEPLWEAEPNVESGSWSNVPMRERVDYLWRPYIPLGEVTVIAGPQGVGKGTAVADIAARVTAGRPMPLDGETMVPGHVLWAETEDSPSHTLAPRFEAARADISRIRIVAPGDSLLANLRKTITENDVRLVVLSPLVSFLSGLEDANSELAVRAALQKILADVTDLPCSVLGIMHPNKQVSAATLQRIMGSTAFTAFVRSVLVIGDKDEQKRLAHAKHNLSKRGDDLLYSIVQEGANPDDGLIRADWARASDNCCVESLWDRKTAKRAKTGDWLVAHLVLHGEKPATEVVEAGVAGGYTAAAIMKACQRSKKVKARKEGFDGPWLWSVSDAA
jgi:hypothetical protein